MDSQELEDIYNEETYLQKEGKTGLVADFLYDSCLLYTSRCVSETGLMF